jgi:hypothetical protein
MQVGGDGGGSEAVSMKRPQGEDGKLVLGTHQVPLEEAGDVREQLLAVHGGRRGLSCHNNAMLGAVLQSCNIWG